MSYLGSLSRTPDLWEYGVAQDWKDALEVLYPQCIADVAKKKKKAFLIESDKWFRGELRQNLKEKVEILKKEKDEDITFLTSEEFVKIFEWKLTRGWFRPMLMDFAKSNAEELVNEKCRDAFLKISNCIQDVDDAKQARQNKGKLLGCLKEAIDVLSSLKGVGPATASAILSAAFDDVPFMADEAVMQVLSSKSKLKYTAQEYSEFAEKIIEAYKADEDSSRFGGLSFRDMSDAMWASSYANVKLPGAVAALRASKKAQADSSRKRKLETAGSSGSPARKAKKVVEDEEEEEDA
jgi:hypothetical protein